MNEERPPTGHYIVCGFGIIGYRIVELLHRLGEKVVVIAESPREEWRETALFAGIQVLDGDARDPKLQQRAGLGGAKALIATTDKDLVNIEIALDTKRARPDLTVVVRLFDQSLARRLEESFDVRRAIGMATLAAPAFAAAAIGSDVVANIAVGGEMFVVGDRSESQAAELRGLGVERIAKEMGVAVLREPSRREPSWTLVARREDWNRMSGVEPTRSAGKGRRTGWFDIWRDASPVVKGMLSGFLVMIAISVVVFWLGMGLSPVDALYFVVTTVTTTGYGDITPRDHATWLKVYSCLLMVLGSATVATFYSLITDFVITSRFRHLLGRRRVPEAGHVLVIGMGNVGYRVV
ncbi:MAG: NAD-binding protein, partial [Acidobacteria bacterium]|nr:NAD-binding protein [Acidobacteriota bacterium]